MENLFDWANLDSLKKIRLLGGLAKRLLSLDMILHWELRQSVEAYLGHVLHAIALGTYNVPQFYMSDAFRAIGIHINLADDADESVGAIKFTELDHHVAKGFRTDRFAITDRWGKCREFDDSSNGAKLHAQWCHNMRTKAGCRKYMRFNMCGCECPYMHARSSELAKWLTEKARDPRTKSPPPWHRDLHPKDDRGQLMTHGLPYIEGVCVTPTRYRELNPNHERPNRSRTPPSSRSRHCIDAFETDTLAELQEKRAYVTACFREMQDYW